ncbi:MAG TPA: glycosyltransferase family 2 protein, partial [Bacteroidales bacterium]|nr:glycosyltransferase family 2 protein [Bacteroidales bacterium]
SHIDQKNWAITQAVYPHILSLDADESLSAELKESILEVKKDWEYDGYYFNRLTNYCGKWIRHTTWYPSRKLRLWDSRKGSWGGINPHDQFILEPGCTRKYLKGDILHYSYYQLDEHRLQSDKYSTIQARSYYQMGVKTNFIHRCIHVSWRFFFDYIIRSGFLDGKAGFMISLQNAREVRQKYTKLRDLYRSKPTGQS